jgi:hypothetical protein
MNRVGSSSILYDRPSKSEIHRLTGIARTTIDRIIDASPTVGERPR